MENPAKKRAWAVWAVLGLAVAAAAFWLLGRGAESDPISRVRDALVQAYAMAPMPEDEGYAPDPGFSSNTYLSPQSPAATKADVRATIQAACGECSIAPYYDALFVTHKDFATMQGGTGPTRFLIVTWEGPLGDEQDGGLAVIDVWDEKTDAPD